MKPKTVEKLKADYEKDIEELREQSCKNKARNNQYPLERWNQDVEEAKELMEQEIDELRKTATEPL